MPKSGRIKREEDRAIQEAKEKREQLIQWVVLGCVVVIILILLILLPKPPHPPPTACPTIDLVEGRKGGVVDTSAILSDVAILIDATDTVAVGVREILEDRQIRSTLQDWRDTLPAPVRVRIYSVDSSDQDDSAPQYCSVPPWRWWYSISMQPDHYRESHSLFVDSSWAKIESLFDSPEALQSPLLSRIREVSRRAYSHKETDNSRP